MLPQPLNDLIDNNHFAEIFKVLDAQLIRNRAQYARLKAEYTAGLQGIALIDFGERLKVFIETEMSIDDEPIMIPTPYLVSIVTLLVLIIAIMTYSVIHVPQTQPLFNTNDTRFKILIVPFKETCLDKTKSYDVGDRLAERLTNLNKKDSLHLNIKYLVYPISKSFDEDSAKILRNFHHADQIIYGNYLSPQCGNGKDQICLNYDTNKKLLDSLELRNTQQIHQFKFEPSSISDLEEGKVQGKLEILLYSIASRCAMQQKNYSKALQLLRHKEINLKERSETLFLDLANTYYYLGNYRQAIDYYEKVIALNHNSKVALNHNSKVALNNMGLIYALQNKKDTAEKYFYKAIELDSYYSTAFDNLDVMLHRRKQYVYYIRLFPKCRYYPKLNTDQ